MAQSVDCEIETFVAAVIGGDDLVQFGCESFERSDLTLGSQLEDGKTMDYRSYLIIVETTL